MNRSRHRWPRSGLLVGVVVSTAWGCSGRASSESTLTVLAASSLTDAFAALERQFEREHPGVDVQVSTAGSQALRVQIEHGAPGDVFASADPEHMQALRSAGLVTDAHPFAGGGLAVVVPADNPAQIESLEQLPRARRVVLGAPEVPVGRYARALLDRADHHYGDEFRRRVEDHVVSQEPNVRLVLAKVELGEADAAIVYRSDVTAARRVATIPIPPALDVAAEYHVGVLVGSEHPDLARRWVEHLESPPGQATLHTHGFSSIDDGL